MHGADTGARRGLGLALALLALSAPAHAAPSTEDREPGWLVPTAHSAGLLFLMRVGASMRWPVTYDISRNERNWSTFKGSWSAAPDFDTSEAFFEWDHDPWTINLLGHGLMGSEIYLRHRQYRHRWWLALGMTVAWTVAWEYLIEGWHKHPSGIDLLWSPAGGALIGEGRFWIYERLRRLEPSPWRHVLLYLVDPLGQLERDAFDLPY